MAARVLGSGGPEEASVGVMGEENAASTNSITVNVRVYMHCDACERSVRRTIKKIDGVETVEVNRDENKVTVTGDFKAEKVLRKIKKKNGKKAEVLLPDPEEENHEEEKQEPEDAAYAPYGRPAPDMDAVLGNEFQRPPRWDLHYFDDENTEACRIM
ncbi:heavy metal-associated isoprenylated plant protein 26-like [Hordeum vulgare]|nr:heavy metal-associated isoprenylated plant protein 26-like [Hordeum vulgare]